MSKKNKKNKQQTSKPKNEQTTTPVATVTVQPEVDKAQGGVTVVISSTVLGQKRAEYSRHKEKGMTEDRITERMTEDAQLFGVTLEKYQDMLNALKSRANKGEDLDVKRKEHTDKILTGALRGVGFLNGLLTADVDSLNFPTLQKFISDGKQSLTELVELLQYTDITTKRGKQAWMIMLHAPVFNFITEQPTDSSLLSLFVGGWSDKSRRYDQYGIRQEASGAATFYRPVSYEQPITSPEIIEE
jgi:hypothetical protein